MKPGTVMSGPEAANWRAAAPAAPPRAHARDYGGPGSRAIYTSLAFLAVIIALVGWLSFEGDSGRNPETSPGA